MSALDTAEMSTSDTEPSSFESSTQELSPLDPKSHASSVSKIDTEIPREKNLKTPRTVDTSTLELRGISVSDSDVPKSTMQAAETSTNHESELSPSKSAQITSETGENTKTDDPSTSGTGEIPIPPICIICENKSEGNVGRILRHGADQGLLVKLARADTSETGRRIARALSDDDVIVYHRNCRWKYGRSARAIELRQLLASRSVATRWTVPNPEPGSSTTDAEKSAQNPSPENAVALRHKLPAMPKYNLCPHCGKVSASRAVFFTHCFNKHGDTKPFKCLLCGKGFAGFYMLKTHEKVCTVEKSRKRRVENPTKGPGFCVYCLRKVKFLKNHYRSRCRKKLEWGCDTCYQRFKTREDLCRHQNNRRTLFQCQAPNCGRQFERELLMKSHWKAQHVKKLCSDCGLHIFVRWWARHCRMHERSRKFKQDYASGKFVPDPKKPFFCMECGVAYKNKKSLWEHKKTCYVCPICGGWYKTKSQLDDHKLVCENVTKAKPFQCLVCQERFHDNERMRKHVLIVHPNTEEANRFRKCVHLEETVENRPQENTQTEKIGQQHTEQEHFLPRAIRKPLLISDERQDGRKRYLVVCLKRLSESWQSEMPGKKKTVQEPVDPVSKKRKVDDGVIKRPNRDLKLRNEDRLAGIECVLCMSGFSSRVALVSHARDVGEKTSRSYTIQCKDCSRFFRTYKLLRTHDCESRTGEEEPSGLEQKVEQGEDENEENEVDQEKAGKKEASALKDGSGSDPKMTEEDEDAILCASATASETERQKQRGMQTVNSLPAESRVNSMDEEELRALWIEQNTSRRQHETSKTRTTYRCPRCPVVLSSELALKRHGEKINHDIIPVYNWFKCLICQRLFNRRKTADMHKCVKRNGQVQQQQQDESHAASKDSEGLMTENEVALKETAQPGANIPSELGRVSPNSSTDGVEATSMKPREPLLHDVCEPGGSGRYPLTIPEEVNEVVLNSTDAEIPSVVMTVGRARALGRSKKKMNGQEKFKRKKTATNNTRDTGPVMSEQTKHPGSNLPQNCPWREHLNDHSYAAFSLHGGGLLTQNEDTLKGTAQPSANSSFQLEKMGRNSCTDHDEPPTVKRQGPMFEGILPPGAIGRHFSTITEESNEGANESVTRSLTDAVTDTVDVEMAKSVSEPAMAHTTQALVQGVNISIDFRTLSAQNPGIVYPICEDCRTIFRDFKGLDGHSCTPCLGTDSVYCESCGTTFANKMQRTRHACERPNLSQGTRISKISVVCHTCLAPKKYETALCPCEVKRHRYVYDTKCLSDLELPTCIFPPNPASLFQCSRCPAQFSSSSALEQHVRKHDYLDVSIASDPFKIVSYAKLPNGKEIPLLAPVPNSSATTATCCPSNLSTSSPNNITSLKDKIIYVPKSYLRGPAMPYTLTQNNITVKEAAAIDTTGSEQVFVLAAQPVPKVSIEPSVLGGPDALKASTASVTLTAVPISAAPSYSVPNTGYFAFARRDDGPPLPTFRKLNSANGPLSSPHAEVTTTQVAPIMDVAVNLPTKTINSPPLSEIVEAPVQQYTETLDDAAAVKAVVTNTASDAIVNFSLKTSSTSSNGETCVASEAVSTTDLNYFGWTVKVELEDEGDSEMDTANSASNNETKFVIKEEIPDPD